MFLKKILVILSFLLLSAVFNPLCATPPIMVEKNLFSIDRKPPLPQSEDMSSKPAKPGMEIGNIQLDGVIIENNAKRAILRMKNLPIGKVGKTGNPTSPFLTVREGEMVNDYRVIKIEPKSVSLEKEGETYRIGLFAENKVANPPSPAPAVAPPPNPGANGNPVHRAIGPVGRATFPPGQAPMRPESNGALIQNNGNVRANMNTAAPRIETNQRPN